MDPPFRSTPTQADPATDNEAFQILSDDTRLEILQALWEGYDPVDPTPMRFSDLRDRVGVDDPGRLNYHLNELRTNFLSRNDDGYVLRESGKRIIRVLHSGTALRDPEIEPVEVDMSCWYCGGQPVWSYEDGWRYLECTECEARCVESFPPGVISKNEFPPSGLLDRTPNEINEADRVWVAHRRASVMDGVCPECSGAMPVRSVEVCDDHDPDWEDYQYCDHCGSIFWMLVSNVCDVCKYSWGMPTLFYPTRHPAVIAFYYDHGIEFDLARAEQRRYLLEYEEELLSEDPLRIRISIPIEDERLRLTYDERMEVVNLRRHERMDGSQ